MSTDIIDEQRGLSEAYVSATNSTNLRVEAERRGDADVIIAAAWSMARVGGVLLRLHSEFDRSERPRPATAVQFMPLFDGKERERVDHARAMARDVNVQAISGLFAGLHSMPQACLLVADRCARWGIEEPEAKARAVVRWWLHSQCPTCEGTKFQVARDANRHTGKACHVCHGVGTSPLPHGQQGRRIANWMDTSVEAARCQIRNRLHVRNTHA